jgi:hypothetical protein
MKRLITFAILLAIAWIAVKIEYRRWRVGRVRQ